MKVDINKSKIFQFCPAYTRQTRKPAWVTYSSLPSRACATLHGIKQFYHLSVRKRLCCCLFCCFYRGSSFSRKPPCYVHPRLETKVIPAFSLIGKCKMNPILCCDWLHEGKDGAISYPLGCHARKISQSHVINHLLNKLVRSRWLDIGLVLQLFCDFMVHKQAKKNLAKTASHLDLTHI